MPRRYQKTRKLLPIIKEKIKEGWTQKEIEKELGLEGDRPIHGLLKRERKKESQLPRRSGRKPAATLQEYKYECKRLKMENELLRDFLQSIERK
jgi:hypothetical protein